MQRIFALLLILCGAFARAQIKPGITAEDYFSFEFISDPQISPDGQWVAYTVATIDQKANRRVSRIWIASTEGTHPAVAFTGDTTSSTSPRWSPDGRFLAFLSARDGGRAQIWLLSRNGGEARRVSSLENGASSFEWSPDGTRFVCLTRTGPPPSKSSDVRHYTHISYKFNDTGYFDEKRSHIAVIDVRTGAAKQITDGDNWNDLDPHWSPDSTRIAFVSNRTGKEFDLDHNSDVWTIAATGEGGLTKISDHAGPDNSPRWSPDGRRIAFLGAEDEEAPPLIYLAPATGGQPSVALNKDFDQTAADLIWAEQGRALYLNSGVKGETHLYRVDASTGAVSAITSGARAVRSVSVHEAPKTLVYLANDFGHLDDLYVRDSSGAERQLTHLNTSLWEQRTLATVERLPYTAADGWRVDGFLVKPIGWEQGKKYPMIVSIHGGPAGMYGVDWYHEFQVYAARGWAVFFSNPRGSTGYGRNFQRGVMKEWGGKAYTDIMTGVGEALKRNPWIDRDRLGVTGGSYGGYMTNWITTQTDIFRAAVTLRSISNFISDDGTRDGAYGHEKDFGGDIFQNYEEYWKYSPLHYAAKVKTPTLVLHSDNDFRVPIEQGEQWFRALQHFGVASELVMFPRENHNLTRTGEPKHLVESINWQ
ncbi:MAG: S9 family peptidase, partial [Bryobacteraceae bacterium]